MKRISPVWSACLLLTAGLVAAGCKDKPQGEAIEDPNASTPAAEAPAQPASPAPESADLTKSTPGGKVHNLPGGLLYEDLVVGTGKMADPGLTVAVHYTGWLTNGMKFDSSFDRGQPYPFVLGQHQVIDGWDQGIKGMRVGGKRKLTVPPAMAYAEQGYGGGLIPPNATLVFEVQLVDVH